MPDNGHGYGQVAPYQSQYPQMQAPLPVPVPGNGSMTLIDWAEQMKAAAQLAAGLARTSFVPQAFSGRVEEAAAAIMTGYDLGLSPTASLRAIYVIKGTPAMYARAMQAVLLSKGHSVWVEEMTSTRAVARGHRKGEPNKVQTSTWTMDRAKTAELLSNAQYKKNPTNMLHWRAVAEVCWMVAPDALHGIEASVEELGEDPGGEYGADVPAEDPSKPARRVAKRKPLEKAEGTEPPLPPAQATIERQDQAAEPVSAPPIDGGMSEQASRRMFAMFREAGITEKEDQLRYIAEVIGRTIESRKELTPDDGSQIMDALSVIIPQRETQPGDES
jgi:hypothetical protein